MLSWRADAPMPLISDRRLRKRWRYVGVYGPEVMLCAGMAEVGPLAQSFWAIWDRRVGALRERTVFWRPGRVVRMAPGVVSIRDGDLELDLALQEDPACARETRLPHGAAGAWIWTRKQAAIPCRGAMRLAGEETVIDALAVVDDTAGFHDRDTIWRWSAGVGRAHDGAIVGWNLVTGVNDPPSGSERAVWRNGVATEVGPVHFDDDLGRVSFAEGAELHFAGEAVRERHDNLGLLRSDYVQPFGTFSGELPGAGRLAEGFGVMEDHRARW